MFNSPARNLVNTFVRNSTGIIELNRPAALNSLNHEMIDLLSTAFDEWIDDDSIHRVVVCSASEKAFCAGGDVRAARDAAIAGMQGPADQFFSDEYNLNDDIANFPKPVVAILNGIVMGGGLGIAMHGSHRVVTENLVAAMPEMAIGFSPDVGATWKFSHMHSSRHEPSVALAMFLTTTGWRLHAADALWSGLATDFVAAGDIEAFVDMVSAESLDEALEEYAGPRPTDSRLERYAEDIEACFGFATWAEIDKALERHPNREFVDEVRELLSVANPASLVATAELVTANASAPDLRHALDNELAIGSALRREPNFVEGVRAVLVDKDRNPKFVPDCTDAVDPTVYRRYLHGVKQ